MPISPYFQHLNSMGSPTPTVVIAISVIGTPFSLMTWTPTQLILKHSSALLPTWGPCQALFPQPQCLLHQFPLLSITVAMAFRTLLNLPLLEFKTHSTWLWTHSTWLCFWSLHLLTPAMHCR